MAYNFLGAPCPHCLKQNNVLIVVALSYINDNAISVHLDCPNCKHPSCAMIVTRSPRTILSDLKNLNGDILNNTGWTLGEFWPEPPRPVIPENLSPAVHRIYWEAESHLLLPETSGEAAAILYRKALDVGLREIDPDTSKLLAPRIRKLANDGKLTAAIADWSDQIRQIGNDGAHDAEPPAKEDLEELRGFTEMVMRYLFTLPAMVEARKIRKAGGG